MKRLYAYLIFGLYAFSLLHGMETIQKKFSNGPFVDIADDALLFTWEEHYINANVKREGFIILNLKTDSISYSPNSKLLNEVLGDDDAFSKKVSFTFYNKNKAVITFTSINDFITSQSVGWNSSFFLIDTYKALYMTITQNSLIEILLATYPYPLIFKVKKTEIFDTENGVNEKNEGVNFIGQIAERIRADLLAQKLLIPVLNLSEEYKKKLTNIKSPSLKESNVSYKVKEALHSSDYPIFIGGARYPSLSYYCEFMKFYYLFKDSYINAKKDFLSIKQDFFSILMPTKKISEMLDLAQKFYQENPSYFKPLNSWHNEQEKKAFVYATLVQFLQYPELMSTLIATNDDMITIDENSDEKKAYTAYTLYAIRDLIRRSWTEIEVIISNPEQKIFMQPFIKDKDKNQDISFVNELLSQALPVLPVQQPSSQHTTSSSREASVASTAQSSANSTNQADAYSSTDLDLKYPEIPGWSFDFFRSMWEWVKSLFAE